MTVSFKNFWSLNTDEAVVTGLLRDAVTKDVEVLMPLNTQMKGVDLVIMNVKTKKVITLQVKGSKAYEPGEESTAVYGDGSTGWFFLNTDTIHKATADYFIFLVYVIEQSSRTGRRYIKPHTITIPVEVLSILSKKHKTPHKVKSGGSRYSYYLWVNPSEKKAYDVREAKEGNKYDVSEYLDEKGFEKLNRILEM